MLKKGSVFRQSLAAAAVFCVTALSACGGGGDDGDGGGTDEPAPPMPTVIKYGIGTKQGDELKFSSAIESINVAISYPSLDVGGTWNRGTQAYTLSGSTNVGNIPAPPLFGPFRTTVVEPLAWIGSNSPSAGKIENVTLDGSVLSLADPVQSTVTPTGFRLTYPGQTARDVDAATYLNLWVVVQEPDWWRLASFGGATLSLALEPIRQILDLMAFINGNDLKIAAAGAAGLVTSCSLQPGKSTPGTRKIALENPDGALNPGDTLVVTYTDCWIDNPTDDVDALVNGTVRLVNYIENASAGTFVSTGFREIRFESLTQRETLNGIVDTTVPPITITGTLSLFVTP